MKPTSSLLAGALAIGTLVPVAAIAAPDTSGRPDTPDYARPVQPLVIGHRGASGYRPEHTLASYELAITYGADYIEPDLVSTKDGVLVARHENEISGTTDVAEHPEFADRHTTKVIDGVEMSGWFTEDFTLAELKTLRAVERLPGVRPTNTAFDRQFEVPTFDEVLDLLDRVNAGRRPHDRIGVYPETKHPTYFDSIGLSLEEPLVAALDGHRLDSKHSPVFVQSFEISNLRELAEMTRVSLVQLVNDAGAPYDAIENGDETTYADMVTPEGLAEIATYADGIGPNKTQIIPTDADGDLTEPTTLVGDAHAVGLALHPWTVRAENAFMAADFRIGDDAIARGRVEDELNLLFDLGVDGVFTDQPDIARAVVAGR